MGSTFTRQSGESISHEVRTFFDPGYMGPKQGPPLPPPMSDADQREAARVAKMFRDNEAAGWGGQIRFAGPRTAKGNYYSGFDQYTP